MDCGDNVIVINADKIKLTGKKMSDKVYVRHTGYPGGQRFQTPRELLEKHPERVIEKSRKGVCFKEPFGTSFIYKPVCLRCCRTSAQRSATKQIQLQFMEVINTIGRRKTAVARIYMVPGKGDIKVNGRDYNRIFSIWSTPDRSSAAFLLRSAEEMVMTSK